MTIHQCLGYSNSIVNLQIKCFKFSNFLFLFHDTLAIFENPFYLNKKFKIILSILVKKTGLDFD